VYTFALRDYPHFTDPLRDLDMASFSVVKIDPENLDSWEPKAVFHEIARRYAVPAVQLAGGDRASIERP
jgi:hypothetical protein